MSLSHTPHFRGLTFTLSPVLNNPDHKQTVSGHHVSEHLKNGITQLNLESDDRLNTLISILKRSFKRAITLILSKPSDSQAGGTYSPKEDIILTDVANMLDLAVGKYLSEHLEELQNVEARRRHRSIAAKIFVEIFYEVCTGSDGGFSTAFLSKEMRMLVAQVPQEKPVSKETQKALDALRLEFEALLKKKDDEIHKLTARNLRTEQLRRSNAHAQDSIKSLRSKNLELLETLKSKNKEIDQLESEVDVFGMIMMRGQVARAQSALKEANSKIDELKESLAREKSKDKEIAEAEQEDKKGLASERK